MNIISLLFCFLTLASVAFINGVSAQSDVEEPINALYSYRPGRRLCPPAQIPCPKNYDPICIETADGRRTTVSNPCVLANQVSRCDSHIRIIALVACKDICE